MYGQLMLEVVRQRMAERQAAALRATAAREHRAAARRDRAAAREHRTEAATGAAPARAPAPSEPAGSRGSSRTGR